MIYLGDFKVGEKVYFHFPTVTLAQVPITLAGSPALRVYKDDSDAQSTAGISLTTDFDGVTAQHRVVIDMSADGTFYSSGAYFHVHVQAGTVDGISLVGQPLFAWSTQRVNLGATAAALATLQGDMTTALAAIALIKAKTDSLTFTVATLVDSNPLQLGGSALALTNLKSGALGMIAGTAVTGTLSITQATTDLAGYTANQLVRRTLIFLTGPAKHEAVEITALADIGGGVLRLTYRPLTAVPLNTNTFIIV